MKKISIALSLLAAISMILAACAPAAVPTAQTIIQTVEVPVNSTVIVTQEVQVQVTTTPVPSKIQGTIRVGSWDSGDALEPFNTAIKAFEAKYPGVKVQLESVPQGYGDKLLTQFAAGTAPDVIQVGDGDVAKFSTQGVLEPLDPFISGDNPLDMSVFFPAVADIGKVGGKYYLLTKDYSPLVLYYNKDLFKAAGVDFPTADWTWDDFVAAAQKLTVTDAKGNITQWGVQLPDTWGDWLWYRGISPIIYQNGGEVINADGTATSGYLNSPEVVEAVQKYVDLFLKYKVAPTKADIDALSGQDLFQTGKVAMIWTGRWPLKDFLKNTSLNFGTAGLPAGKKHANSICWAGFALYSKGQNKDTAWAFLKWITAEQGAQEFAKYAFTAVQPIADLQGLATDPYNMNIVADLQYVHPLPDTINAKWIDCGEKYFKQELEQVFLNGADVKASMDKAAQEADACFAK